MIKVEQADQRVDGLVAVSEITELQQRILDLDRVLLKKRLEFELLLELKITLEHARDKKLCRRGSWGGQAEVV